MSDRSIKDTIQILAGTFNKDIVSIVVCTVNSVNQDTRTCDCSAITGDAITDISDVQLMAEVGDGILLLPTVDSTVIVALTTRNTAFVLMYSDVDKIIFRGGGFDGLVKVKELTDKLNNLENKVNDIITWTSTHTHTGVQTGGGSSGTTATPVTGSLTPTEQSDIENENITHG